MEIRKTSKGLTFETDLFPPHRLPGFPDPSPSTEFYNLLVFRRFWRINERISLIRRKEDEYVMKLLRFNHELPLLRREIRIYGILMHQKSMLYQYSLVMSMKNPRMNSCVPDRATRRSTSASREICGMRKRYVAATCVRYRPWRLV